MMVLKLHTENDILKLPPLPADISPRQTQGYISASDEIKEATRDKTVWLARWFNGRLYRVRSTCLWEMKQ